MKRFAGAMQPHHGVVGRNVLGLGDSLDRHPLQIDLSKNIGVFFFQGRYEVIDASADDRFEFWIFGFFRAPGDSFQGSVFNILASEMVRQGVAKKSKEPGHSAVLGTQRILDFNSLGKGVLENVLRRFPALNPTLKESQKLFMVRHENVEHFRGDFHIGFHIHILYPCITRMSQSQDRTLRIGGITSEGHLGFVKRRCFQLVVRIISLMYVKETRTKNIRFLITINTLHDGSSFIPLTLSQC